MGYALFVAMSALFSNHKYWVAHGAYELFEPVWVVLIYMILCYYIYNYVQEEKIICSRNCGGGHRSDCSVCSDQYNRYRAECEKYHILGINDERFANVQIQPIMFTDDTAGIKLLVDGIEWDFSKTDADGYETEAVSCKESDKEAEAVRPKQTSSKKQTRKQRKNQKSSIINAGEQGITHRILQYSKK